MPGRTRLELMESIELHRDEISRVGRTLAVQLSFEYPENVEATVRDYWDDFKSQER